MRKRLISWFLSSLFICNHWSKWARHSRFSAKICECQYCECLSMTLFNQRIALYIRANE